MKIISNLMFALSDMAEQFSMWVIDRYGIAMSEEDFEKLREKYRTNQEKSEINESIITIPMSLALRLYKESVSYNWLVFAAKKYKEEGFEAILLDDSIANKHFFVFPRRKLANYPLISDVATDSYKDLQEYYDLMEIVRSGGT